MRRPALSRLSQAAPLTRPRRINVSVDLDGLGCYHQIHGIAEAADPTAIYTTAMPRLLRLFDEHGVQATLFVITSDLVHPEVIASLRAALAAGHEVASHTHRHPYNLRHWSDRGIAQEIAAAENALEDALGLRPRGFRTPGYNVDTRIVRILAERGYLYDSSVFPCPAYYAAKGAVMATMALTGRRSGSSMTDPMALLAPTEPYRPSRWNFARPGDRKHSLPLWEFPVGVTPWTRLPVIGTTVGALPPLAARALFATFALGQETLQFEMHGIDLLDAHDDPVSDALIARQPDVRRTWRDKYAAFSAFFDAARPAWRFETLAALAQQLDEERGSIVTGTSRPRVRTFPTASARAIG